MSKLLNLSGRILTKLIHGGCILYCASFIGTPRLCNGTSMVPTLHPDDLIVYEKLTALRCKFRRGDIVVAHPSPREYICKRLIAMEFDSVYNTKTGKIQQVPKGHVWLEGDNKEKSYDSRQKGPFPYAILTGKVYLKLSAADTSKPATMRKWVKEPVKLIEIEPPHITSYFLFFCSDQSCHVIYLWKCLFKTFPTLCHMTGLDKNGTKYFKQLYTNDTLMDSSLRDESIDVSHDNIQETEKKIRRFVDSDLRKILA